MPPRHLAIEHVQEARKKDEDRAGEESSRGKHGRSAEIHYETEKGEKVRVDSCGCQRSDNLVEQPLASASDRCRKSCHGIWFAEKARCATQASGIVH